MSSLGPDGTFVEEPAIGGTDVTTDVSAAPLWAAFRDRYTRARERRESAVPQDDWAMPAESPAHSRTRVPERLEIACCA